MGTGGTNPKKPRPKKILLDDDTSLYISCEDDFDTGTEIFVNTGQEDGDSHWEIPEDGQYLKKDQTEFSITDGQID